MDNFVKDIRYALRNLKKAPGFAFIAIFTIALGIGATTAMFSVVNAVLLKPLPFPKPDRLVAIANFNTKRPTPEVPNGSFSYPDFEDVAARNHSFQAVAAYGDSEYTVTGIGEPLHALVDNVSADLFDVLGVHTAIGHDFASDDDQSGHHVAIISDAFWRAHFNGDKSVIGRTIALNGYQFTIIGVMPHGFQFPVRAHPRDLWITFARWHEADDPVDPPNAAQRGAHMLDVVGRLKPGVSLEQANSDLQSIYRALQQQYPDTDAHTGIAAASLIRSLVGDTRESLLILMGAVGLVLLIACANVANLLLARSTARGREIAVRAALGASRTRIIRQLITESVLLALIGAAIGTELARLALSAVLSLYPANLPRAAEVGIDTRVLLFTIILALICGVLFGLVPAWHASSPNLSETMRQGDRTSTSGPKQNRLRSVLVVAQIALGVMLLIGAGLLTRSLERLSHADLGMNVQNVLTANFDLSETKYKSDAMDQFIHTLVDRLRATPGVTDVGGVIPLPLGNDRIGISFDLVDHPVPKSQQPDAAMFVVTDHYLETMQIPLLRGRLFNDTDQRNSAPVMIITQSFAKKYFPNEDPIGRKIEIGAGDGATRKQYKTREIVGIIGDIRNGDLMEAPAPAYYVPLSQLMWGPPTLVIRTAGKPYEFTSTLTKTLHELDPDTPLYDVRTLEDWLAIDLGRQRFQTVLLSIFAAIALLLTAVGLYGVIAYSVAQRTHEIGVRIALGASRSTVLSGVLVSGLKLTLPGIAVGLVGAFAIAKVIAALLYEVPPRDPATYVTVSCVIACVAIFASYVPALRASRVNPMVALRYE